MMSFQTIPKQWGNSLGFAISKDIVEKENLSENSKVVVLLIKEEQRKRVKSTFGTLKLKKPTEQVMDEIDD